MSIIIGGVERPLGSWKPATPEHLHEMSLNTALPLPADDLAKLPELVDLETMFPPVRDQRRSQSCLANSYDEIIDQCEHPAAGFAPTTEPTADSVANARSSMLWKPHSVLWTWGVGKEEMGVPLSENSGLYSLTTLQAIRRRGVCYDSTLPFSDDPAVYGQPFSQAAIDEAALHRPLFGYWMQDPFSILSRLARGFAVSFAMQLPAQFESSECLRTGEVKIPQPSDAWLNGHEMVLIGYDRRGVTNPVNIRMKVRNSWGENVGVRGNFFIPLWFWINGYCVENLTISQVTL